MFRTLLVTESSLQQLTPSFRTHSLDDDVRSPPQGREEVLCHGSLSGGAQVMVAWKIMRSCATTVRNSDRLFHLCGQPQRVNFRGGGWVFWFLVSEALVQAKPTWRWFSEPMLRHRIMAGT